MTKRITEETNTTPVHICTADEDIYPYTMPFKDFANPNEATKGIQCIYISKDETTIINGNQYSMLLLLLEGKIHIHYEDYYPQTLKKNEFTLLPPATTTNFSADENSRYILIPLDKLKSPGNINFYNQLNEESQDSYNRNTPLPIKENIFKLLQLTQFYNYQYQSIFDIIFIILRVSYSREELTSLLLPIFKAKTFNTL